MSVLISIYIFSFIFLHFVLWCDMKNKTYTNGEILIGLFISIIPVINTTASILGFIEVFEYDKWLSKPFKWNRK